ncbi:Tetratricopeptide repeat-containing protein [Lutibacter oricola]|uniref:Tetratricopeptide repeat-containing protein n=1 Tax=Lutibacter oricola TaxID=762486 RepID=A0A1H3E0L6_9FLAO|nr:tetratricopeptide repeat protein [Lutibacter oricola]SDX72245.1 Tetratricopeptide repeat-containing protein [Lutibacter oricola]
MNFNKIYIFLFFTFTLVINTLNCQEKKLTSSTLSKALLLKFKQPDSAAFYFEKGYKQNLIKKDTLSAINFLIQLSELYAHSVNYGKSYDGYWEALLLAEKSNDLFSTASIYQGLGWLYSFYKRNDEALKYFNHSISIRKNLLKEDKSETNYSYLQSDYFAVLNLYRTNSNYIIAKKYLDSCYQIKEINYPDSESFYLVPEEAFLDATKGNFKKALSKLNSSELYFKENNPSYLVIINALLGKVYRLKNDKKQSIFHFKKSLQISKESKTHINYRIIAYEALSEIYFEQQNLKEAYKYLKLTKQRNEEIFGGQSENNKHLLEIKDKYRIEKDKQNDLINQKHIAQLEHEEKTSFLQTVILTVFLIFLILYAYIWGKHIRNRHKLEKKILREKQKLRTQKQNEILELKNKELTESALRLIEKDEFISSIKKKISNQKENIDINVIKRMLKSIQGTPNSNWKEFEARFTAINQSFYNKLKTEYPQLSQTDQKICALVKLNFPSKDMAKLLGISVESVHTSRYRLRKKLNLDRADNLEEFINKI